MISRFVAALLATSTFCMPIAAEAQSSNTSSDRQFNIPAQSLAKAITSFGQQAGRQIFFPAKSIRNRQSRRVTGRMSSRTALNQLLDGSGLTVRSDDGRTIVLAEATAQSTVAPKSFDRHVSTDATDGKQSGDIVVTAHYGFPAIGVKKKAGVVVDSAVNNDLEAPTGDFSIARMLVQLPGVGYVSDGDEPRYITLRGLASNLNVTTIEGLNLATVGDSGGGDRQVNMQQIPSDISERVDVYKTMTAEQDAAGIGGAINIITRSATTRKKPYLFLDAYGIYSTYGGGPINSGPNGSNREHWGKGFKGVYSTRFGADQQFGIIISGRYQDRVRNAEKNFHDGQVYFNTAGKSIGTWPRPEKDWDGNIATTKFDYASYRNTIVNYGGQAKVEYRSDRAYVWVMPYWYIRYEDSTLNEIGIYGDLNRITDRTQYTGTTAVNYLQFNIRGPDQFERTSGGIISGADWNLSDTSLLTMRGGYTKETYSELEPYAQVKTQGTQRDEFFSYDLSGTQPHLTGYTGDPFANKWYVSRASLRNNQAYEDLADVRADYAYNRASDSMGFGFVTGLEWRKLRLEKSIDATYRVVGTGYDATSVMYDPNFKGYPDGPAMPWINYDKFWNNLVPTLPVDAQTSANISRTADYYYHETVQNAYLSAHYVWENAHFIAGLRYEDTSYNGRGALTRGNTVSFTDWSYKKGNYDAWLPSLNITVELAKSFKVRAGISKTIGRPRPGDIVSADTITCDDPTIAGCYIRRGNPDLKPRRASNYDLSFERYFGTNGIVSLSLFSKDIKDDIYTLRTIVPGDAPGQVNIISQPMNADSSHIRGAEFQFVQKSFPFMRNLGLNVNATYLDGAQNYRIDSVDGVREVNALTGQPNWLGNATVSYKIPQIRGTARFSLNYQGKYLFTVGNVPYNDGYRRAQTTAGFSFWHDIGKRFTLKYEMDNIFNVKPQYYYTRTLGINSQRDYYGQAVYAHLTYRM